jgi:hypothetical protein
VREFCFAGPLRKNPRVFRATAKPSTAHRCAKSQSGLRLWNFSTNPQHSSQQQEVFLFYLEKSLVMSDVFVKMWQTGNASRPQTNRYFHSPLPLPGLYTLRKNEYSTLAVLLNRRNHDRNWYCPRGNSIDGIQRNQISAAQ